MRFYSAVYLAALVSSGAALFISGWSRPVAEGLLVTAIVSLLTVAIVGLVRASAPWRSRWHARRARALRGRQTRVSGILPLGGTAWLALALLEWAHVLRSEALSS